MTEVRVAAKLDDEAIRRVVEQFQSREIKLLQAGRYDDWLTLLAPDIRYWMPSVTIRQQREETVGKEGETAWFDDGFATLELRVKRLLTGLAVEEGVPARLRYFVQNLDIAANEAGSEIEVESNIMVYKTRREQQESFFVGGRDDLLRLLDGEWKLARRTIVLDRTVRDQHSHLSIFL